MNGRTPEELLDILIEKFNLIELRQLAFRLSIDYDRLRNQNIDDFALSLIRYTQRHDLYDDLWNLVISERSGLQNEFGLGQAEKVDAFPSKEPKDTSSKYLIVFLLAVAIVAIIASAAIRLGNSRSRNELPVATAVPIVENTAVPQETPSTTPMPIPPTPEPDETDTAVPTDTPEPTNTPTNPPTPPDDNPPITVTHAEGVGTVYVLAGPGEENVKLGTLEVNEGGIIIGRTASSEWLKIVTDRGKEGWVANCEVVISEPNLDDVPISWSGRVTPKICSVSEDSGSGNGSGAGSTGCVQVSLIKTEVPGKPFDNVLLSWSNVPATTTQLHFWVTGPTNAGESAYVIHPTFSDTDVPYEVELYHFEDGGFEPDATYTYIVQPHNASSEVICTTQGTFVP